MTQPTFKPRDYSEGLLNKITHCTMKHVEVDRGSKLQYVWDSFNNFLHLHLVMLFSPVIKPAWPKFSYHQWFIRLQKINKLTRNTIYLIAKTSRSCKGSAMWIKGNKTKGKNTITKSKTKKTEKCTTKKKRLLYRDWDLQCTRTLHVKSSLRQWRHAATEQLCR